MAIAAADARSFQWIIGIKDLASKPLKAVGLTWNKMTKSATREGNKFKSQVKHMGDSLKRMAKDLRSTGKQLKSFGGIVKNVAAMFGVGVLAFGLIAGIKKAIELIFAFQMSLDTLIPTVDTTSGALKGLSSDMLTLSTITGENFEQTAQWVAQLAEVKPYGKDFLDFSKAVLTYADATNQSREAVGGLFVRLEQVSGMKFDVRRMGDAMKYWADQSSLTNAEIMGLAGSFEDLLLRMPGVEGGEQLMGRLIGLGVAVQEAGGQATDVNRALTDLMDVYNVQQRAFLGRAGMTGAEITAAFEAGNPEQVFRALVKAAKSVDPQLIATMPQLVEQITGFPAPMVAALAKIPIEKISDAALDAAVKSKAAHDAFNKRQAMIERRWARMKQQFVVLITKIAEPLAKLLNKVLKPLEKLLKKITTAASKAINVLVQPLGDDETIFDRLKESATTFWQELTGKGQMDAFKEKFQATMQIIGKWLGKNVIAPAIGFAWNDVIDALGLEFMKRFKIHKPEWGLIDPEVERKRQTEKQIERLSKLQEQVYGFSPFAGVGRYGGEDLMQQASKEGFRSALEEFFGPSVNVQSIINLYRNSDPKVFAKAIERMQLEGIEKGEENALYLALMYASRAGVVEAPFALP
jgi:hypothetical protein